MTKLIDVSMRDLAGAAKQFRDYLVNTLGFDGDTTIELGVFDGSMRFYMRATDKFQSDVPYDRVVGRVGVYEVFDFEHDWDAANTQVWERLKKAMSRDERELRFGMQQMGSMIESAPSFTSLVGKMFADRIKAARDEATAFMIEHHGWTAYPAANP